MTSNGSMMVGIDHIVPDEVVEHLPHESLLNDLGNSLEQCLWVSILLSA